MNASARLLKRLSALEKLLSGAVDSVLEGRNNVQNCEWEFARQLRILFRNSTAIQRQRAVILCELRMLGKKASNL